ncbi:avidin/streptavidin family protein [Methylosinus sp. Ce-a6]|uniref:avidin/streptavidin family protein n=1 Tax=Methylosinus sp. Ce-a6 TaxID=2172005 RepID=UPI0013568DB6
MLRYLISFFCFWLASSVALGQTINAPSKWINQRGSILSIDSVNSNGSIKGQYVNKASGTECTGTPYDLGGRLRGRSIKFSVVFTDCRTVTVWRGTARRGEIFTRFEAAYPDTSGRIKIWRGRDVFSLR